MGQRHMTYVLAKQEDYHETHFSALYNQWNFEKIQPQKVVRFLRQVNKWNKGKGVYLSAQEACDAYRFLASIHDGGLSRFHEENNSYNLPRYGIFCEDNNNGWQIVLITIGKDKKIKVNVGFKPGSEWYWGKDGEEKGFMSLKDYMEGYFKGAGDRRCEDEPKSYEEYVAKGFTKAEQKLLEQIDASYDQKLLAGAEKEIAARIHELQVKNSQTKLKAA